MSIIIRHPVDKVVISQGFGENPQVYTRFGLAGHNGWDYAVPTGTSVMAAADGQVEKVGFDAHGYGNYVKLNHGEFFTLYGHLSRVSVEKGERVEMGQAIGLSGNTGFSTGPHLHFELRIPAKKRAGYPAGEMDPGSYLMAVDASRADGSPQREPDDGWARVKYAGTRLRLSPEIPVNNTLQNVRGAVSTGDELQVVGRQGEWVAVMVYIHESCVVEKKKEH